MYFRSRVESSGNKQDGSRMRWRKSGALSGRCCCGLNKMCEVAQGDGKEKRMESGDLAKSTTCGHCLDVETEGQEESKKFPGFPIKASESLREFMNRNRKVRGGDLVRRR